ncbi:MAG: AMP-binding protein [Candidatus Neomarinimicrobiota bacterium]
MADSKIYTNSLALPRYAANLAVMLKNNALNYGENPVFQENKAGSLVTTTWSTFYNRIVFLQALLAENNFRPGDRLAILSRNSLNMLEMEMAVMSMGAVSVPIFSEYPGNQADRLLKFCEPAFIAVADQGQYDKIQEPGSYRGIISFEPLTRTRSDNLIFPDTGNVPVNGAEINGLDIAPDTITLMMYTSGTMGLPKCVQLTHSNILSQQAAMKALWDLNRHDRFLSYLPWHHSFGGIFEKFAALVNGAVISLENGFGKDINILLENWKLVKPTVFFSVPRIYQALATQIQNDPEVESIIFHDDLRFIFTAAAPLPTNISDIFKDHGVPVLEGWGLTETSPCCTITDPALPREEGVVGVPIPGVSLKLSADGEINVKGPNVMRGYYNNPEATKKVLNSAWFSTGDIGEYADTGLKLISRKDRIFKLSNAEKVIPSEIENLITRDCAYLAHALIVGSGRDYPVILLFPNKELLARSQGKERRADGCECPETLKDFSNCINNCLPRWNDSISAKYSQLKKAILLDYELSIENEELTPSMKLAPNVVGRVFKAQIENLYGAEGPAAEKVYIIDLE